MAPEVVLTYDETLNEDSTPQRDAFTVMVAGAERTVSQVHVSGMTVTLTLASAAASGETVTVAYTVPAAHPIRDAVGNDALSFSRSTSPPTNNVPTFTDGTSITRSVAENTASGQNIGTAIAATDTDTDDTLTYSLDGTNAASFDIVSTSGQLQTNAALNFETKSSYSVTVTVSDGSGGTDSINVTIEVTDVNDAPVITTVSLADATEGVAYDDTVKATDPDADDIITFAKVSGPDWMTVGENGAVGGTPGVSDVRSDIAVSISAENTDGAADTLTTSIAVIAKDVVVMADPDIQNDIPIPADRSSISLDFSNSVSLSIAFTGGEVADQIISVKQVSTSKISTEFPTVPAFTNAVHYIDINLDVHNSEAELTFGYNEETVTGLSLSEDSLVVSVYDSLDARGFIWHVLPSTVDTDNNTITVTTGHFALWAIASNTEELITSVDSMEDEELPIPDNFILEQNYPNPFNPTTTIQFNLPRPVHVSLKIYNALGQEVRHLIDTTMPAGENSIIWDGKNNTGQLVSSGLYVMKLQAGTFTDIKRMTFIK